ncbi:uncharacterized protein LOC108488321 [Gossypium arboreum]|uniref:uncharacterized protein LOC108488321 n=1 Tax=Gossypium arboreum TaxID=29729 RepID=UPI000819141F|nr:uncharacterized protein LOC108488321 [Gossypium arboreum]
MTGEMIENAIRNGRIDAGESAIRSVPQKKENEVNNAKVWYSKSITVSQPKAVTTGQGSSRQESGARWGGMGKRIKVDVSEVKTPLKRVWKEMVRRGLVTSNLEGSDDEIKNYCEFHHEEVHEIQECEEFRAIIQGLMDNKEIEFYKEITEEEYIYASESVSSVSKVNYPVVISSRPKNEAAVQTTPKIIIQKPAVFSYKDNKRVPWSYNCNVTIPGKESSVSPLKEDQNMGSHTHSGRRYDLKKTQIEAMKGRDVMVEQKKGKEVEPGVPVNEPVKEEEAKEFLKFLKHSEYNVVEQWHKQPARISILALLLSSKVHQSALMKIPPGGIGSTKALHITTRCKGYTLLGVLVDNGSALNVLPLSTLNRLLVDSSHMKGYQNIVRAFDGTEKRVMERIEIPLLIGPTTYEVDFLVMNIKPSYNCLLGRPWIHSAGAVPSSLHQKLKLVSKGRLVTINAEEDIIAVVSSDSPYLEIDEEAIECSFRSLEFVNATFITEGSRILEPKMSKTTIMGLHLIVGRGALLRKGLGRCLQGRIEILMLKDKHDHFGLGLKPDARQRKRELKRRQERRRARASGGEIKWEPMIIPHISRTFVSGGIIYPE